ncbi:MAG: TetR/AcrR family transcriptional regulator [Gammaproteobacteria bacterium]|nr:TetR/AcrR family transcriptional regulator [Gammaproteobacteria bacterium]TVQ48335.1 MAG: TetR/AcrR family transcriptional regulator [Gammaproteobacteria bacterium]
MDSPATRDPDLTRARILDAALALFVEHGVTGVSLREIAETSGVTKSLIHHHFGSKEALWTAVKAHAFSRYAEEQMAELEARQVPDTSLLQTSVLRYFRFLQQRPEVVRLLAWIHLEADEGCSEMDAELVRLGAERIRQAQQAGLLRDDVNPTHVVTLFVHACSQWFTAKAHHSGWPGIGDDQAYLDDFLRIFMAGLAPPEER